MLQVIIPPSEQFDPNTNEFFETKEQTLCLEHSLVSVSKWESKWHKSFLGTKEKTQEEILDYIRCMTLTQNVNPSVYRCIPASIIEEISRYIEDPMTATWFSEEENKKNSKEVITSEIIYYWMIAQNIPVEFQKWHLNRLITLIRVCSIKNQPPKKMSKSELASRNRALNEARKQRLNTKG